MSICYDVHIHFIGCVWENNESKERQKAMNRKIWKALGIAVCMLALAAPRAMAERYEVGEDAPFIKFGDAVDKINKLGDTENEIVLMQDITLGVNYTLTNDKATTIKTTTIKGEGHTIFVEPNAGITVTGKGNVLNLGAEGYKGTLTIDRDPRDGSVPETRVAFITVSGGATANMYGNVTLQNWQFAGNACVVIMGSKSNSVFNMYGGVIENCSRAVTAASGATFYMQSGKIKDCRFGGNRVISVNGGSKFIMDGGTISGCKADEGGGLYADHSTVTIKGGTISECTAGTGGGLYATNQSTITISGGTISECTAGTGGGLYVDGSTINITGGIISGCEGRWGGGLYATNQSTITINNGTISGCTAKEKGGGLYATNSSKITINKGTISECTAVIGNGGGLCAENFSTITISDGTISGSTISGCEAGTGGGLYADKSTVTINNGTISECKATMNNGGGLYATNSSTITINNGTISECKATMNNGGGLYANNSAINISDGTISGCEGLLGGGLYAEKSSTIEISGGTISGCKKVGAGGGLFVVGSTIRISGGIISECTTSDTGNGGGLYAKDSTIKITGGRIENNKAAHGGGVALIGDTTFEDSITNWTVIGNEAYATGGVGGGIKLEKGLMNVSDKSNKIYNNTAGGQGADICLEKGASITLPDAAGMGATYLKSGINIDGWYNDNPRYTPSESGQAEKNLQLSGPLSLVASYTVIPVRIEIDANGGVGGSGSQTVHEGTTVTLEAPTKEGYLFTGWEDKEKGKSYPAGEDGKVNITVNENMTLTAVWEARSFTVTYVLLNGETRTETVNYGQNVTLGEEPRTGYTFVGWKDGEKMYHAGETITVTGDMTLTAEWKKLPSAENLPKTGDESPVLLWGAALAVSAAACFVLRRKK